MSVMQAILAIFDAHGVEYTLENDDERFLKLFVRDYDLLIVFTASGAHYASEIMK